MRVDGGFHSLELVHQSLVHMEPAGSVQKDQIITMVSGMAQGGLGDFHRVPLALFKDWQVQLAPYHL